MIFKLLSRYFLIAILFSSLFSIASNAFASVFDIFYPDPQYLVINKCGNCLSGSNYLYFYGNNLNIVGAMFDEITNTIGTLGTENRKLGIGFIIQYFYQPPEYNLVTIQKILDLSLSKNVPVVLKFDSHYWEGRPDLWNWWDSSKPGYNPENKNNVEWTGWDNSYATKISWYNWGTQGRLMPRANLGSPQIIQAKKETLNRLLPLIVSWYKNLPPDKKYLLAGVVFEGELSIGINGFFYPDGNSYFEQYPNDPSHDPTYGLTSDPRPLAQQGYAAAKSYGIKNSGILTQEDLNEVINRHAQMIAQTALESGLPFEKIHIHGGGNFDLDFNSTLTRFSYSNSLTEFGKPGWSFYDKAYNPAVSTGLSLALDSIDHTPWAAAEWFYMGGNTGTETQQWEIALNNTLNYRSNKFTTVYNWEQISQNQSVHTTLRNVLNNEPQCWLSPAPMSASISNNSVTISWTTPPNAAEVYLNISDNPLRLPSGSMRDFNIHNEKVTNLSSKTLTLNNGLYYYQIVVDGCSSANDIQRRINYSSFRIGPSPTPSPSPTPLPEFSLSEIKQLISQYIETVDDLYKTIDAKINSLDFGWVRKWLVYPASPQPTPSPVSSIPNCYNLTGPTNLAVNQSGTYTAQFYSYQGNLGGNIFTGWADTFNLHATSTFAGTGGQLTAIFRPTVAGTYTMCCSAVNDSIAECRPPQYVDRPPRYPCEGPNYCQTITVSP